MRLVALALVCGLVACGDDDGTVVPREDGVGTCSDGIDNDMDGAIDCADLSCAPLAICTRTDAGPDPEDAGPPPRDVGPAGCSVRVDATGFGITDSCGGADICICTPDASCETECNLCLSPGTCEAAFPRRYRIQPIYAYVPIVKPSGEAWDGDGSGPDLFVATSVDGGGRFETATAYDLTLDGDGEYPAAYSGSFGDFNMVSGSSIVVEVFDEDAVVDDLALECAGSADPTLARSRFIACEGDVGGVFALMLPL